MAVLNYLYSTLSSNFDMIVNENGVFSRAADHLALLLNDTSSYKNSFNLDNVQATYDYYMSLGDPRVAKWPLMTSPWPTIYIAMAYILFCKVAVSKIQSPLVSDTLMKPVLILYNVANVLWNAYIAKELLEASQGYNITCQPVDYGTNEKALKAASALWWYYALKGAELFDSVFFALRGKRSHLSFLHIYHHSTMFCLWWIGVKYVAGGSAVYGAFTNCLVHVLMYSYYTVSIMVSNKKLLWWKKYLTVLQMLQFVAAIVMGVNGIRVGCDFPKWMQYAMVAYMISFLFLFGNFYVKSYNNSKGNKSYNNSNGNSNNKMKKSIDNQQQLKSSKRRKVVKDNNNIKQ